MQTFRPYIQGLGKANTIIQNTKFSHHQQHTATSCNKAPRYPSAEHFTTEGNLSDWIDLEERGA